MRNVFHVDDTKWGQRSIPRLETIERGAISRYARALGLSDPIYFSVDAARKRGFANIVSPPTFAVTLLPWDIPGLTLPTAGVLHGEQEFEWGVPVVAGDTISTTGWGDTVKSRSGPGGRMHVITILSEGRNQTDALAFLAKAVLIVTEEAENASRG